MPRSYASMSTSPPLNRKTSALIFLTVIFSTLSSSLSVKPASDLGLVGDAKFTKNAYPVQLTDPKQSSPSSGLLIPKKPIKFFTSKARKPVSFSTDFTFSISPHNGDGLAFLVLPKSFLPKFSKQGFGVLKEKRFFGVEFDTLVDENANHVGVDVGSLVSIKTSNVSMANVVLNSGVKLHSWVDYDSSSKRVEVRLSRFGTARPYNPVLVYRVDLGEMWRNEEVYVGLSSSSGNSMQTCTVYSWQFRTRSVPKWLHSQPLDPEAFSHNHSEEKLAQKKKICALGFISGLVFLAGCGALVALLGMFLWALLENRVEAVLTIPAKCTVHPEDFRYEKISVVVGDDSVDAKK